jgi:hypothetical protein
MDELLKYERVMSHKCSSEKEFYEFYNSYAREKDFSISKRGRRCKPGSNEVIWMMFCCSRGRYRSSKWFEKSQSQREPRALTWYECPAKLEVRRCENNDIWFISNFVDGYNHGLMKPEHRHMLMSKWKLSTLRRPRWLSLDWVVCVRVRYIDSISRKHKVARIKISS